MVDHSSVHATYVGTVIEVIVAGLPVFASDMTRAGLDRIMSEMNEFLHPAGHSEALAEQILTLLETPDRRADISAATLRTAREWSPARGARLIQRRVLGEDRP